MVMQSAVRANGSRKQKRSPVSQTKPHCDWCGERFKQSRSDQRYCCSNHRRDACERRKLETVRTLAAHFASYKLTEAIAGQCVDYDFSHTKTILTILGYKYSESERRWQLQPRLRA